MVPHAGHTGLTKVQSFQVLTHVLSHWTQPIFTQPPDLPATFTVPSKTLVPLSLANYCIAGNHHMASSGQTVLQFSSSSTSVSARVHPLVIFNICDFYVRRADQAERVIGTLLGSVLPDGTVDICNSYAVPHNESSDQVWFSPFSTSMAWFVHLKKSTTHSCNFPDISGQAFSC